MEYAIQTRGLTKDYGSFVLDSIDLTLPKGTILGLIGENGAGKSTLIKCLLGIIRPTAGTVELADTVGYVPDECPFSDVLKVKQVAAFLPGLYPNWDSSLFDGCLQRFNLPTDKKVKELSRGMKMKLTIAAALAHRPQLLVLDEATSGLDPVVRDEILDVFLDFVSDDDHAILISSHITSDLEKLCDYVAYLHKGTLTVQGPKDELLAQYGKVSCTREQLSAIPRDILVGKREGSFGCQALVSDRAALKRALPNAAVEAATLEDIIIYTTKGEQ